MSDQEQCKFSFGPGLRCQMVLEHDEPYYPYLDYGQWGEYSDILSNGTDHQICFPVPSLPIRDDWTGNERKGPPDNNTYPIFRPKREPHI